jgi:hypothetical protein
VAPIDTHGCEIAKDLRRNLMGDDLLDEIEGGYAYANDHKNIIMKCSVCLM